MRMAPDRARDAAKSMMPVPDVMIATSSPCTGGVAAVEALARKFDCPLFILTIPPDDSKETFDI